MDIIEVEIINWSKFNPRKDIKHPSWFAMSNRLLEDPKIFELTGDELRGWLYILCQASQTNSAYVRVHIRHACQSCNVSPKIWAPLIAKLEKLQCIQVRVRDTNADVRARTATIQDSTIQDNTNTHMSKTDVLDLHPLIEIWNAHCGPKLPKVTKSNATRNKKIKSRWPEQSPEAWIETVKRIAASKFCSGGGTTGWRATFDWLIQPETYLKANEGKYDNRDPMANPAQVNWTAQAQRVFAAVKKFGASGSPDVAEFLGDELHTLVRKTGGMGRLGQMPDNDWSVKSLAGQLKAAAEAP